MRIAAEGSALAERGWLRALSQAMMCGPDLLMRLAPDED